MNSEGALANPSAPEKFIARLDRLHLVLPLRDPEDARLRGMHRILCCNTMFGLDVMN